MTCASSYSPAWLIACVNEIFYVTFDHTPCFPHHDRRLASGDENCLSCFVYTYGGVILYVNEECGEIFFFT